MTDDIGVGLDWYNFIKNGDIPINDMEKMLYLHSEMDEAIGVDDVDTMVSPHVFDNGQGDGDALFQSGYIQSMVNFSQGPLLNYPCSKGCDWW